MRTGTRATAIERVQRTGGDGGEGGGGGGEGGGAAKTRPAQRSRVSCEWCGDIVKNESTPVLRLTPTLQTLQDPILLLPWGCFRGGGFPNPSPFAEVAQP
jgi:hypothetical protein